MCYIQQFVSSPSLGAYSFMLYDSTKALITTPGAAFIVMNTETLQLGLLQHRSNSISNSQIVFLCCCSTVLTSGASCAVLMPLTVVLLSLKNY